MGIVWTKPVTSSHAWRGADLGSDGHWLIRLTAADNAEIRRALQHAQGSGVPMLHMQQRDFPLGAMAARLAALAHEIRDGLGFSIVRGLDIKDYSDDEVGLIFWGLGLYLGNPLGQNTRGDLLGHVYDQGRSYGNIDVRGTRPMPTCPITATAATCSG